jgi:phage-related protein
MLVMPLITGFAAISGPVLIVAAVLVGLVAVGVLVYKNWDTIKAKAIEIWGAIKSFFVTFWNATKTIFMTVVTAVATFINAKFGYIFTAIRTIMTNIGNIIRNYWNIIKNIFMGVVLIIVDLITGDFGAIKGHVSKIMGNIKTSISSIWESIKTIFSTALSTAKQYVVNTFNDMVSAVTTIGSGIASAVTGAWNGVTSFLSGIDLYSIGSNIIQGLINGISSMASGVLTAIQNVAGGIKDKITNALKIKSPSRWMRDMIGKNLMLGLSIGIDTNKSTVMESLDSMTNDVQTKAQLDLSAPKLPTFSNNTLSKQQKTDPVYIIELEGKPIAKGILPHITDIVRLKTGMKFS